MLARLGQRGEVIQQRDADRRSHGGASIDEAPYEANFQPSYPLLSSDCPAMAITPNRFLLQMLLACIGLVAALCVLAWTPPVAAQAPDTVQLERLTWTEIRDAVHAGTTTIIIPVGGTEQSGPYMAVGKHNVRVAALSDRIARQLGNALVAPVFAYVPEGNTNPPTSHMRFPGTITVPTDVFEMTIESAAESFRVHGFTNIVLLGDHGGYQDSLKVVAERLNRKWASTHARVHYIPEYYKAVETTFVKELQVRGLGPDIGTHADLTDTSLMLAVDASMVRLKQLQSAPKPDASTGVYGGDPRKSSAELGRLGIDAQMSETVQAIRHAVAQR
jgi:creatinine amidohydrolase/Fe(II)-dependent formamide hydrolase-like protein